MHRFKVTYKDNSGDMCHVTVFAMDHDDAILQARHEYWDIAGDIIEVIKEE